MMDEAGARAWACEEFSDAELGDGRRVRRLLKVAAAVARQPRGTITGVFDESAAREGAFRLMESTHVPSSAVGRASHSAAVRRSGAYRFAFVAMDGSSLSLKDTDGRKRLGFVGAYKDYGRGLQVMTSLAVAPEGTPLGVCGQSYWARERKEPATRAAKRRNHGKHALGKETQYWLEQLMYVKERFSVEAPSTTPWFQLDRGADVWLLLELIVREKMLVTVRAARNRALAPANDGSPRYLWPIVQAQPVAGQYSIRVPARHDRPARIARMSVRFASVQVSLQVGKKRRAYVRMTAVYAREMGNVRNRLEWMLLTTANVANLADACTVICGYTQRWRIEEFHRAWKRGVCNVEDTQLRDRETITKWAIILAAVAARSVRLAYVAREKPILPATEELSQYEIDAIIVLKKKTGYRRGDVPALAEAVRWIADLGGYTGKSSGGPPGPTVIGRGLERVGVLALGLKNLDEM